MTRKITILFILLLSFSCSSSNLKDLEEKNFPVYGNYCGPKYPPKGYFPVPLDNVDASCKKHDHCYETKGYFNRSCDEEIIADLKAVRPLTPQEKLSRKLIIAYFTKVLSIMD